MPQISDTAADPPLQVLHVTDPHLFADPGTELYGVRTADSFAAVLQQALAAVPRTPDAILVTGDIGDDESAAAYRRFRATLEATGVPAFCLPGNHDDPATMARLLNGARIQYGGEARLGRWRLLLLESHLPGTPHGELGAARLAALEATLRSAGDQPLLVAVHHPPMPVGSAWIDALGLRDGATLLALLQRFPQVRAVVSGHVHQAFEGTLGALRLLTSPSTCAQFTPGTEDCVMDARPPGWRWLQLHPDGRVTSTVHWLQGWQAARPPVDARG